MRDTIALAFRGAIQNSRTGRPHLLQPMQKGIALMQIPPREHEPRTIPARFAALLAAIALALCCALPLAACESGSFSDSQATNPAAVQIADIPEYSGALCIDVNNGEPGFTDADFKRGAFMEFSDLDFEGRCGAAFARIGTDTLSSAPRGDISQVHPSGWEQRRYDFVDQEMLYNRNHLIAHQLCGEDANEKNLITGTRTMNAVGMTYYENIVASYVKQTGNHVLYRVTPIFAANDLVARGVQMEAESIEDGGQAVRFNVFVYNVEPGVEIDYVTGESRESSDVPSVATGGEATTTGAGAQAAAGKETSSASANGPNENARSESASNSTPKSDAESSQANRTNNTASSSDAKSSGGEVNSEEGSAVSSELQEYVLNTKSMKFHRPTCSSVDDIANSNKQEVEATRDELISKGYSPCKQCNP